MQANIERYRREALELRAFKRQRWDKNRQLLMSKIGLTRTRPQANVSW